MQKFDSGLWRNRAWARFRRALAAGKPKAELEPAWALDVLAICDLGTLVEWCEQRKIDVVFVKKVGATYYQDTKQVKISSRLSPQRQLLFLLHECGHHLIGLKEHNSRYAMGYPQTDAETKKTFHHRLTCLEEEMEAWHRGWNLAERLNLRISREDFDAVRLECLRTYVKWTLRPGKMEREEEE